MTSKFSLIPGVKDHFDTLTDYRTGSTSYADYALTIGLPISAGAAALYFGVEFPGVGQMIGGVGILTGFLFGLVIFVFQLRLQMLQDPRMGTNPHSIELINQLFRNLIYAVVVGLGFTTLAIAADVARGSEDIRLLSGVLIVQEPSVTTYWTALLIAVGVHLLMIVAMCLKRVGAAYSKLTI